MDSACVFDYYCILNYYTLFIEIAYLIIVVAIIFFVCYDVSCRPLGQVALVKEILISMR